VNQDVVCFSHLRWNSVFQRPQHLIKRCAQQRRVYYVEEPIFDSGRQAYATLDVVDGGVRVVVPHLPDSDRGRTPVLRALLDTVIARERIRPGILWYYTPMALAFSDHLNASIVVYDCMDELSNFAGAPRELHDAEAALLKRAAVVFTGGRSLFESKRHLHSNIHMFPSSVDSEHFASARLPGIVEPADQARIPRTRVGFFGVLDERLDRELLAGVAALRPQWHLILLGPVAKIDPASLPSGPNIHYLGQKTYAELPRYLAGWDVAMLPFARNEATRYISPTKTPEYLAGGKPVVSTSIADVVVPYNILGLVRIADTPRDFVLAVEAALGENSEERQRSADRLLATMSWDTTWQAMWAHIEALREKDTPECSITSSLERASQVPWRPNASPPAVETRS